MSYIYKNDSKVDREMFPKQPATIGVYFYDDPDYSDMLEEDLEEISMDVCDCQYAILNVKQFYEWTQIFDDISKAEDDDQYLALSMSWHVGEDLQFVMVIDEGQLTNAFDEYCSERDIPCQFHIDNPSCKIEDYDYEDSELSGEKAWDNDEWVEHEVYTGADYNRPHLIRMLHKIQENTLWD